MRCSTVNILLRLLLAWIGEVENTSHPASSPPPCLSGSSGVFCGRGGVCSAPAPRLVGAGGGRARGNAHHALAALPKSNYQPAAKPEIELMSPDLQCLL